MGNLEIWKCAEELLGRPNKQEKVRGVVGWNAGIQNNGRLVYQLLKMFYFILFYFILFYFILFYFILFYFILFYFILFYIILSYFIYSYSIYSFLLFVLVLFDKCYRYNNKRAF